MDKIHESKYGPYEILDHVDNRNKHKYVKIRFINTGYETEVRKDAAMKGIVKDDLYGIDFNMIYNSRYGPYKIIEYIGRGDDHERLVKIKFIISGAETILRLHLAQNGSAVDPLLGLKLNTEYLSNNYGIFKILEVRKGSKDIAATALIQFLNTGNIKEVLVSSIRTGSVKDDNARMDHSSYYKLIENKDEYINSLLKNVWHGMMNRCYNNQSKSYNYYGKIGIKISDNWLNINNFIIDCRQLPQFDKFYYEPNNYRLDKDYLQLNVPKNLRIYSKETCMFLSIRDNSNLRIIENKRDNPEKYSSKYYHVSKRGNGYVVTMSVNGVSLYIGKYYDEIIAAAVANYWHLKYHNFDIIPLLNDVPAIPPEQFIENCMNPKIMCKITEK